MPDFKWTTELKALVSLWVASSLIAIVWPLIYEFNALLFDAAGIVWLVVLTRIGLIVRKNRKHLQAVNREKSKDKVA